MSAILRSDRFGDQPSKIHHRCLTCPAWTANGRKQCTDCINRGAIPPPTRERATREELAKRMLPGRPAALACVMEDKPCPE